MGVCSTLLLLCFGAAVTPLATTERCLSLDGSLQPTTRSAGQQPVPPRLTLELNDWNSHQLLTEVAKIVRAPRGRHTL